MIDALKLPDHYVHYTENQQVLAAICGRPWELISDYPEKVNCPDCLKKLVEKKAEPKK